MLRSKTKITEQTFDALSLTADIIILGGSTRQMYYTNEQSYEDDRKWVPCILGGYVYTNDPTGVMTGNRTLTGIEWYTQLPAENDYTTGRITNPSSSVLSDTDIYDGSTLIHEAAWRSVDYLISDGSGADWCSDVPANCLIVHKNVPQLTAIPIYAVLKFIDTRTGQTIRVLRSVDFSTESYNNQGVSMKGDSGDELLLDPISFTDTVAAGKTLLDVEWPRTVKALMTGVEGNIADNEACYLWTVEDNGTWRQFTDDEINAMSIEGAQTKTLKLDARLIDGYIRLRCYGCRREAGAAWKNPMSESNSPFYGCQLTMTMNDTLEVTPVQNTGNQQTSRMDARCDYTLDIRYNGKDVPSTKRCLFNVQWWAQNLNTGVKKNMGTGPTLSFIPSEHGFSFPQGMAVWAEVTVYKGCKVMTQSDKWLTQGGKYMIAPTYG